MSTNGVATLSDPSEREAAEQARLRDGLSGLEKNARKAAIEINRHKEVVVASHVDADGLSAAGLMCTALQRCSIDCKALFFKQLDPAALGRLADLGPDMVIFTDLGSGLIQTILSLGIPCVIADHHRPSPEGGGGAIHSHINPHLFGLDGATELSGSGASFILARALCRHCDDLSALAVVGAVGDLQDMAAGRLVGLNRELLAFGESAGVLSYGSDLKLFGRQTRPVFKMLEYNQDPFIPNLSGNEDACISFLKELGIRLGGERWRRWIDLNQQEKAAVVSALMRKGLRSGISSHRLQRLIGEVYTLVLEREGTELRDASEFSTLLNATARYGHAMIGLDVCMGDRDKAFDEARSLLSQHRQNLVAGLNLVKERGITALGSVQYFDAGSEILDTIVGIVAGMSFQMADRSKPILAFASTPEGKLKVSARGTQDLVRSGLDLSAAMSAAAGALGGVGGGHSVASGATIPAASKEQFLELVDRIVGEQIAQNKKGHGG